MKKYKTEPDLETGLLRIIALKDFSDVIEGQSGGLIEKEANLSQEGDCWVYYSARVFGNARVYENACIYDDAQVYGKSRVFGDGKVYGKAMVCGKAEIYGKAHVFGNTKVSGNARICGRINVCGNNTKVCGNVKLWSIDCFYININLPIKDSKGYVVLGNRNMVTGKLRFCTCSSNIEDHKDWISTSISILNRDYIFISGQIYLKNIQIIRQLYEEV